MDQETRKLEYSVGAAVTLDALSRNPYPIFRKMREEEPISWIPALDMWYVTRYSDVHRILMDTEHFVTGTGDSTIYDTFGAQMLTVEGQLHERYKAPARRPFMPKNIRAVMDSRIQALTDDLIGSFERNGRTELRASFASRLPVQTTLALFGLPIGEEAHLRRWYDSFEAALANFGWEEDIRKAAHSNIEAFHGLIGDYMERFQAAPNDSLLSALVNAPEGERLTDEEIKRNVAIIFFGGISTVEALVLNTFYALFTHPEVRRRVQADLSLLPRTIEEVVRWQSPVQSATRHVTEDVEVNGVTFKRGETVNCMLGAANRDLDVFADPDRFDIDRPNAQRHLGFAAGPHHCLGSHLARTEARIAVETLLRRLPGLRPDPAHTLEPEGYEFRQPRALHLTWAVQ